MTVTILKNGRMVVKRYGTNGENVEYEGPYQNPVKVSDGSVSYQFTQNEAYLREDGELAIGCLDEGKPCVSELYDVDSVPRSMPSMQPESGNFIISKERNKALGDVTDVIILAKFSEVTVTDISINRGNCPLLSYGSVIKKPISPVTMKFGQSIVVGAGAFCNPLEVTVTTNQNTYTVEFPH